jgi:hypothetical protein
MNEHEIKLKISNANKILLLSKPNSWQERYWANVLMQLEYILENNYSSVNKTRKLEK